MHDLIQKQFVYAVVGASQNSEKYGHKVFRDLLEGGYEVVPIHPKGGKLLGEKVYETLSVADFDIDVVVFVVPPKVTKEVLAEAKGLGIRKVWFQPGSFDEEVTRYCRENSMVYEAEKCIMMARKGIR